MKGKRQGGREGENRTVVFPTPPEGVEGPFLHHHIRLDDRGGGGGGLYRGGVVGGRQGGDAAVLHPEGEEEGGGEEGGLHGCLFRRFGLDGDRCGFGIISLYWGKRRKMRSFVVS